MSRAVNSPLWAALQSVFIGVIAFAGVARAQQMDVPGTLSEMSLPGGLRGALAAIGDRGTADRSQFLLEFIRRSYNTPITSKTDPRDIVLRSLVDHLDVSSRQSERAGSPETLPLPLPAAIWIDVVFGGRATSQNLVSAILRSRSAALLYYGLLSLDDTTRAWLATQPDLVADLASQHSAAFVVAAPGLRVTGTVVRVPGGELAQPAWEALVGRRANEPADFVRALLAQDDGRLAYFFGAMAQLTPPQIRLALNLESPDADGRVAAARRLHAVFERVAAGWKIEDRTFWRPALDPALLVADLRVDDNGRMVLPGARRFWKAVFADVDQGGTKHGQTRNPEADAAEFAEGEPLDFAWLCEQVFTSNKAEHRRRYQLVLFTSRIVPRITPGTARDAIEAIRAAEGYPALIAVLERAKLADVAAFASAARRAAQLSAIEDDATAVRALAQFQGALVLVTRAALRGSLPANALSRLVMSLSAVDLSEGGDYEGRLVHWLVSWMEAHWREAPRRAELHENAAGPVEEDVLRMLAGPAVVEPRFVDWEGTRYRLDLARGEAARLARLIGEQPRPFLSSARTLVIMADSLGEPGLTRERLRKEADALERVAQAVKWTGGEDDAPRGYREAVWALRHDEDVRSASRLAPVLRLLADDLLARGLMELAYAVALGQSDRASISADEAARRHEFGRRVSGERRTGPWRFPVSGTDNLRPWHVTGSVLGLDVRLAEFSLVRLSSRPPSTKPSVADDTRRVLVEAVALVEPASLTDADRDTIVAAIRTGRARLAGVRTPIEAVALADEIRISPARRTLLAWVVARDSARVVDFLSPSELLWLGLGTVPIAAGLHAWGAPGEPRLGCLCLQLIDRRPWETLAGRWHSGIFASGFPDLNLRLAELLAGLQMPAPLLGPVLASATLDFVNTATSRDFDDRRGLVEFVQALRPQQVEQYLALLTTDGPLVPVETEVGR